MKTSRPSLKKTAGAFAIAVICALAAVALSALGTKHVPLPKPFAVKPSVRVADQRVGAVHHVASQPPKHSYHLGKNGKKIFNVKAKSKMSCQPLGTQFTAGVIGSGTSESPGNWYITDGISVLYATNDSSWASGFFGSYTFLNESGWGVTWNGGSTVSASTLTVTIPSSTAAAGGNIGAYYVATLSGSMPPGETEFLQCSAVLCATGSSSSSSSSSSRSSSSSSSTTPSSSSSSSACTSTDWSITAFGGASDITSSCDVTDSGNVTADFSAHGGDCYTGLGVLAINIAWVCPMSLGSPVSLISPPPAGNVCLYPGICFLSNGFTGISQGGGQAGCGIVQVEVQPWVPNGVYGPYTFTFANANGDTHSASATVTVTGSTATCDSNNSSYGSTSSSSVSPLSSSSSKSSSSLSSSSPSSSSSSLSSSSSSSSPSSSSSSSVSSSSSSSVSPSSSSSSASPSSSSSSASPSSSSNSCAPCWAKWFAPCGIPYQASSSWVQTLIARSPDGSDTLVRVVPASG